MKKIIFLATLVFLMASCSYETGKITVKKDVWNDNSIKVFELSTSSKGEPTLTQIEDLKVKYKDKYSYAGVLDNGNIILIGK